MDYGRTGCSHCWMSHFPVREQRFSSYLGRRGHNWIQFKKDLRDVYARGAQPDVCITVACDLANLDVNTLAPGPGRWPDPGLAQLVTGLAPVWEKVTGRTAKVVSVDKECSRKACQFADWLGTMHEIMGLSRPPVGRILDIVRARKIEKSGTRHSPPPRR
jgi:hypothetical protein